MQGKFEDVQLIKPYGYKNYDKIVSNEITFNCLIKDPVVVREMDDGDLPAESIVLTTESWPMFDRHTTPNTRLGDMTKSVSVLSFPYTFKTLPRVMFNVWYNYEDDAPGATRQFINYVIENEYVNPQHDYTGEWRLHESI